MRRRCRLRSMKPLTQACIRTTYLTAVCKKNKNNMRFHTPMAPQSVVALVSLPAALP